MPRPRTGKIHVGERQEKRKNGDIYVYERVTKYNPETKKQLLSVKNLKAKYLQEQQKSFLQDLREAKKKVLKLLFAKRQD